MANFSYRIDRHLVLIPVVLYGKTGSFNGEFILDTGASLTVIDHEIITTLGYSAREGTKRSLVTSVVGKEEGYRLVIEGFEALGERFSNIEVAVHDLKQQGVEGLVGMTFLERFPWCLDPARKVISVTL